MPQKLHIAVEISRQPVCAQVLEILQSLPQINTRHCKDLLQEQKALEGRFDPDIIILDDGLKRGDIVAYLKKIQALFVQSAIFVISPDSSPKNIVRLMKAGASEYICNPVKADNLIDAVEEFRIKRVNAGKVAQGKICSFISSKGGLGSSVIAVNSAAALARQQGQTVALCDMSLGSGDASVMLDVMPSLTIADLCRNIHRLDVSLFRGAITRHITDVDFLAAPLNPADITDIKADHVRQILTLARKLYDYILLDCPAMHLDGCTLEALKLSDRICIISDLSVTAIRNASRLCQHIEKLGIDRSRISVLINRYIKGSTLSVNEVEKSLNRSVFWIFPNDFEPIVSSINRGIPLVKLNSGATFSRNILDFVEKLQNPNVHGGYRGIKGVFGKVI
ncbi:MAG: AAA family ATPase [Desulfuromonadales bacterium]|nr:AAA family ATPase [Desulfuromonadales bacterium]